MHKDDFLKHSNEAVGVSSEMSRFLDILKHLIHTPSVVGSERPFLLLLKRELEETGIKATLHEGILVAEGKDPNAGMMSAHIDRHGLVCTGAHEFQYAAFTSQIRGDMKGDALAVKMHKKIMERFLDKEVKAYNPWSAEHLGLGRVDSAHFCERRGKLLFDVKGLEEVHAGTPIAFVDTLTHEKGLLSAQLDNVLSAAIILFLYERGYQGRAFFTAAEEVGNSWHFLLEWFKKEDITTDALLVLDTSPYPDRQSADTQHIVLRNKDANAEFSSPLSQEITDICDTLGVTYSYKDEYIEALNEERVAQDLTPRSLGNTELGRLVHASEGSIQGTTFQLPTTGYHTTKETVSMACVLDVIKVLKMLYVEEI